MSYTLYDAIVPTYLQILRGSMGWLDKAAAFASASGKSEADVMAASLAPDMLPFNRQVRGYAMHAQGGIEGAIGGVFSPDRTPAPETFSGLQERLDEAVAFLETLDSFAFEELIGKPMRFELGDTTFPFIADQFLLSFSQPNFYFHATTSYAILRNLGVELGKTDFLAEFRIAT